MWGLNIHILLCIQCDTYSFVNKPSTTYLLLLSFSYNALSSAGLLVELDALGSVLESSAEWRADAGAIRARMLRILSLVASRYLSAGRLCCAVPDSAYAMQKDAPLCCVMLSLLMQCQAMPCLALLCHAMPCPSMPSLQCCVMLRHAVPCCVVPCHAVPCHAMPCHAVLCRAMPCCPSQAMLRHAMLCCAMLRHAMLCCARLCIIDRWLAPQFECWGCTEIFLQPDAARV